MSGGAGDNHCPNNGCDDGDLDFGGGISIGIGIADGSGSVVAGDTCLLCQEPHYGLMVKCSTCGLAFHSHCVTGFDGDGEFVCTTCSGGG